MSLTDTIRAMLSPDSGRSPTGGEGDSTGAYWCDDCGVRVRDVDVDADGLDRDADGTPLCPDCGAPMTFERSSVSGCAC